MELGGNYGLSYLKENKRDRKNKKQCLYWGMNQNACFKMLYLMNESLSE